MIRPLLIAIAILAAAAIAWLGFAALLGGPRSASVFAVLLIVGGLVAVGWRWRTSPWTFIVLHLLVLAVIGLGFARTAAAGSAGPAVVIGGLLHFAAIVWWVAKADSAIWGTAILAMCSGALFLFAIAFGWLCGTCFAVHGTMMAALVLWLARDRALVASGVETADRLGLRVVVAAGAASLLYLFLTFIPGMTRTSSDRAMMSFLASLPSITASANLPGDLAAPSGLRVAGSGPPTLEAFLEVGDAASSALVGEIDRGVAAGESVVVHLRRPVAVPPASDWEGVKTLLATHTSVSDRTGFTTEASSNARAAQVGLRGWPAIFRLSSRPNPPLQPQPTPKGS